VIGFFATRAWVAVRDAMAVPARAATAIVPAARAMILLMGLLFDARGAPRYARARWSFADSFYARALSCD
jgi:hypothetical protein